MSFVDDFGDMCVTPITVSEFLGRNSYGAPQYGSPVVYPSCRISYKPTMVRRIGQPDTQQVVARGTVWIMTNDTIGSEDQIEFPDGETPPILAVDRPQDETGAAHVKVWFG